MYLSTAARYAGVHRKTVWRWTRRGHADLAVGVESRYATFARAMARAEAQGEVTRIVRIQQAAERDWRAAAWWLKRRYPERWGDRRTLAVPLAGRRPEVECVGADGPARTLDVPPALGDKVTEGGES